MRVIYYGCVTILSSICFLINFLVCNLVIPTQYDHSRHNGSCRENSLAISNVLFLIEHRISFKRYLRLFWIYLYHLNLFYNSLKSSQRTLRREQHATRIYLVLLTTGLTILVLYNALDEKVNIINVQQPTLATYQQLILSHDIATSIRCPCERVSVRYSSFLEVITVLHQVCSSVFVQTSWIQSFTNITEWPTLPITDFRIQGFYFFLNLRAICAMAIDEIQAASQCFASHRLNNAELIPDAQLISKTDGDTGPMRQWHTRTFMNKLQLNLDLIQSNQLMTIYSPNWFFPVNETASSTMNIPLPLHFAFNGSSNCSCATSKTCTQPMLLDNQIIPGFFISCIPIESVLRSTLLCLYNQTCVDRINVGRLNAVAALVNPSILQSVYPVDCTVTALLNEIFLERWLINASYAEYYNECAPTSCFYSVSVKKNALSIILSLLGLYGGLIVALRFLVPHIVTSYARMVAILMMRTNRVHSSTTIDP